MAGEDTRQGEWVVRKSARGFDVEVFEWDAVARINEAYLNCVFYLYGSEEAAHAGGPEGGSGCLVFVRSDSDDLLPVHTYAVTNRHVVEGNKFTFLRFNVWGESRGFDVLPTKDSWIWDKEDDLAVAPIKLPDWAKYLPIDLELFSVTREKIKELNIGVGDDVFMVSRLVGNEGKARNRPALRFGNISVMPDPDDPILIEGRKQEAYLAEMRSMGGCSGSPTFFYIPYHAPSTDMKERRGWAVGPLLLGIDCAHINDVAPVLDLADEPYPQGLYVKTNTGMAAVIPVWRLERLLKTRRLVMARKAEDERRDVRRQLEEKRGRAETDSKRPRESGITSESFEEALRRASRKVSQPESETKETSE